MVALAVVAVAMMVIGSCKPSNTVWEAYTSREGGFSIIMPPNPKKVDKVLMTPFGKQAVHFIEWRPESLTIDKFKLFQVSYTGCPSAAADSFSRQRILDSSIVMRAKDFTELDIDIHTVDLNGYFGRAFIFDVQGNNTIAIVKECIVNGKLYDITVVLKKNYATNKEVHQFFDSFKVIH
jgi:hypothetical protein